MQLIINMLYKNKILFFNNMLGHIHHLNLDYKTSAAEAPI